MTKVPELRRGQRLSDTEREHLGADLLKRYQQGSSIRQICQQTGYSIGRVRRLLIGAGVEFRTRGGATNAGRAQRRRRA